MSDFLMVVPDGWTEVGQAFMDATGFPADHFVALPLGEFEGYLEDHGLLPAGAHVSGSTSFSGRLWVLFG